MKEVDVPSLGLQADQVAPRLEDFGPAQLQNQIYCRRPHEPDGRQRVVAAVTKPGVWSPVDNRPQVWLLTATGGRHWPDVGPDTLSAPCSHCMPTERYEISVAKLRVALARGHRRIDVRDVVS